jgi:VanZ family protein
MVDRQALRGTLCGVYALLLLGMSLLPSAALAGAPVFFPGQDKLVHFLMYGCLAVLLSWTLQERLRCKPLLGLVAVVALAAGYGGLMEILQGWLSWTQRACSWGDMLANLVGAVSGVGLFLFFGLVYVRKIKKTIDQDT